MPRNEEERPPDLDESSDAEERGASRRERDGGSPPVPEERTEFPAEIPFRTAFPRLGMDVLGSVLGFVAVGIIIAGLVWYFDRPDEGGAFEPVTPSGVAEGPRPEEGKEAPDFRVRTLDGEYFQLSDLRGQPVWINFWASWCRSCRAEMPDIQAVHEKYHDKGLVIIAVNREEPASTVKDYAEGTGLTFTIGLDFDLRIAGEYGVTGLPMHFFVDEEGVLREIRYGSMSEKTMEEKVEALLSSGAEEGGS